jgi:hypothetical protein
MKGPHGYSRYAPLHEAHERIRKQLESRAAAREVTDRRAERRDADQAKGGAEKERKPPHRQPDDVVAQEHSLWNRVSRRWVSQSNAVEAARHARNETPKETGPVRPDRKTSRQSREEPSPEGTKMTSISRHSHLRLPRAKENTADKAQEEKGREVDD